MFSRLDLANLEAMTDNLCGIFFTITAIYVKALLFGLLNYRSAAPKVIVSGKLTNPTSIRTILASI
jgi:hypothetical protein